MLNLVHGVKTLPVNEELYTVIVKELSTKEGMEMWMDNHPKAKSTDLSEVDIEVGTGEYLLNVSGDMGFKYIKVLHRLVYIDTPMGIGYMDTKTMQVTIMYPDNTNPDLVKDVQYEIAERNEGHYDKVMGYPFPPTFKYCRT